MESMNTHDKNCTAKAGCAILSSLYHPSQREWSVPHLHPSQLVYPVFVTDREDDCLINGFEPNKQWGFGPMKDYGTLINHLEDLKMKGLTSVMLFGVVRTKDNIGSCADDLHKSPVVQCIRHISQRIPLMQILCDVCLCEYTSNGHCGVFDENGLNNSKSIERLAEIASVYAKAGAHMVCPSDMMDNRIGLIRSKLNSVGCSTTSIMAYTSKKASCLYAPFRDAVESTFKDNREAYQHPVGSITHAMRALERDLFEGADAVIVKPSLFYTDIIREFSCSRRVPVVAYVVSGEYKMLMEYGKSTNSLEAIVKEAHISLLRSGATVLITYFTPYILEHLSQW